MIGAAATTGAGGSPRPLEPGGRGPQPPKKTHYRSLAVREDNAQEHSMSLAEYSEALRFRKSEIFFFSISLVRAAGPGRAPGTIENSSFQPNPGETRRPTRPHTASHARNAIATETEIDFLVGSTPQPPIHICVYIYIYT